MKHNLSEQLCPKIDYKDLCREETQRIDDNLIMLRSGLSKSQRKLLLHIIDDMSLITEKVGDECFDMGFRISAEIMIACLY